MRGKERGNIEKVGRLGFRLGALLSILSAASCQPLETAFTGGAPERRPEVLEGSEISLVTTRFSGEPRVIYTSGARFQLRISFDPALVDLSRLKACGLWAQDRPGGPWKRVGTYPAKREPVSTRFVPETDGAYGLRASAIYKNGLEILVPGVTDQPLVWLFIDRTPPKLTWISPEMKTQVLEGMKLDLEWGASEMRFGEAPSLLEWSGDGGATWSLIDRIKPTRGMLRTTWRVPKEAARSGARPFVRVTAWDFVGNRSAAILPLAAEGSPQGKGPEPAVVRSAESQAQGSLEKTSHREEATEEGLRSGTGVEAEAVPMAKEKEAPEEAKAETAVVAPAESEESLPRIILKNFDDPSPLPGGSGRYIFFATSGLDEERSKVSIDWRASPKDPWTAIAAGIPAREGKFLWKLPEISTEEGALRLRAVDPARKGPGEGGLQVEAISASPIVVDSQPPVAEIRGVQRSPEGKPVISLNVYDRGPAGLAQVLLFVTADGGTTWKQVEVEDPAKPVTLEAQDSHLGFWAVAADRAGNGTPRPQAGSAPQVTFEAEARASLVVEDFEDEWIRGGDQRYLLWKFSGPPDQKAMVDASADGGSSWDPIAEAPAQNGKVLWIAPGQNCTASLRVRVRLPDGSVIEGRTHPVRVDGTPPQLEPGQIPARVAGDLKFPLAVTDPGDSGVDSVLAFIRPVGEKAAPGGSKREGSPWIGRPKGRVAFDPGAGQISISVADLPEGTYELFLSARDKAGNGGLTPAPSSAPFGKFAIDRTPVAMRAAPTALPWVEGLMAAVQVELDLSDAVPPLWLEERTSAGWKDVFRWESLAQGDDLYRFPIPVGIDRYEVRFGIRDASGNVSYAVVGPKAVERSIELLGFPEGESLKAGTNCPISWKIHPALEELSGELKVVVAHRPKAGADWVQLYDDLPVTSACIWTVPAADAEDHSLRVSLLRRGSLMGQAATGLLKIAGGPPAPQPIEAKVVAINEESLYYSDRADLQFEKYRTTRAQFQKWFAEITAGLRRDAQGSLMPQEMEKLSPDLRRQAAERERLLVEAAQKIRENFQKALERDPQNYKAAYGLAQLLHRTAPDRPDEAIRYLERAVEIKPDHAAALNDLGATRILRGDYEGAEEALRKAVSVEDHGSYRYNLALALFHQRRSAEARECFEQALAKGGPSVKPGEVYYYIVLTFLDEGKSEEARRRFGLYRDQIPPNLRESLAASLKNQ